MKSIIRESKAFCGYFSYQKLCFPARSLSKYCGDILIIILIIRNSRSKKNDHLFLKGIYDHWLRIYLLKNFSIHKITNCAHLKKSIYIYINFEKIYIFNLSSPRINNLKKHILFFTVKKTSSIKRICRYISGQYFFKQKLSTDISVEYGTNIQIRQNF